MTRGWTNSFTGIGALLVVLATPCSAQDDPGISIHELLQRQHEYFQQIETIEFEAFSVMELSEATVEAIKAREQAAGVEPREDLAHREFRFEFAASGDRHRCKLVGGGLDTVEAFDGEQWYRLEGTEHTTLSVTSDVQISLTFGHNPLLTTFGFAYGPDADHALYKLRDARTWEELEQRCSDLRAGHEYGHDGVSVTVQLNEDYDVGVFFARDLGYLPIAVLSAGPSLQQVTEYEMVDVGDGQIAIPTRVEANQRRPNGEPAYRDVAEIVPGSLRLGHDLADDIFTIPMSAADEYWADGPRFAHGTRLAQALLDYARDHGRLPHADRWMDAVESYIDGPDPFRCELIPREEFGYAFNARLSGRPLSEIRDPAGTVLIFQARHNRRNVAGGAASVIAWPRATEGVVYVFADGHVAQSWRTPNLDPAAKGSDVDDLAGLDLQLPELKQEDFAPQVLQAEGAVLVEFSAPWCGPCHKIEPLLAELAQDDSMPVMWSVNKDEATELAERYGVRSIPCLIIFRDGEEIARRVGVASQPFLRSWIATNM